MLRLLCSLVCVYTVWGQNNTIIDVLRANKETYLVFYLNRTGLLSTLEGPGPFTIFAPSNSAFSRISNTVRREWRTNDSYLPELTDALKYHVVAGNLSSTDLRVNEKQLTSLLGPNIRVNYYRTNNHVSVEGAYLYHKDLVASNGIVHIIERIITPPEGTIVDIVMNNPSFSALANLIQTASLTDALKDGPYTLFAPNNDAFSKLSNAQLQAVQSDPQLLKTILLYHVIPGTLYSTGMHAVNLHSLDKADSERLVSYVSDRYQGTGSFLVDGSTHSTGDVDINASNGVIHTIDHVLIPASVQASLP